MKNISKMLKMIPHKLGKIWDGKEAISSTESWVQQIILGKYSKIFICD